MTKSDDSTSVVVVTGLGSTTQQTITAGRHTLQADEPESLGGADAGPRPYELLLAALGACKSMTLGIYARRKKWPLERIAVHLEHTKVGTGSDVVDQISCALELGGSLDDEQRQRLLEISAKCPVHRTLQGTIKIESRLA